MTFLLDEIRRNWPHSEPFRLVNGCVCAVCFYDYGDVVDTETLSTDVQPEGVLL